MRSPRELAFRLRQEAANLLLATHPPRAESGVRAPLAGLPDPQKTALAAAGTRYAANVEQLAEEILRHRFPLLGTTIETGPEIEWRCDYRNRRATGLEYFRKIPYLDFARAGDHKIIWELNRHQHLVLLAQARLLTGREEFFGEITAQLESWWAQNPYGRGINWTSALEVAFRALSWIWIYHLAGARMGEDFRRRFLESLYAHGRYLEFNLSVYFSPNTHLLGEAVALHALGTWFPDFPGAARWKREGGRYVREHMAEKVRADGSYFEQSSYYHVYALDMLLFAAVVEEMPKPYREKLARMGEYADALLGPGRRLPFLGDDDGGRFFHPYGERDRFARAALAACAQVVGGQWEYSAEDSAEWALWLTGRMESGKARAGGGSRLFEDAGMAAIETGETQILMDAGPFGPFGAGHSHSDTLSVIVRRGVEDVLIDPGTYTYVAEPAWRDWFRGTAAHNTIGIDGLDQGTAAGPFRWASRPEVRLLRWESGEERTVVDAVCAYGGFFHRRQLVYVKPNRIFILDSVEGASGRHRIEQYWHAGAVVEKTGDRRYRLGGNAQILLSREASCEEGWRSPAPGMKVPAPLLKIAVDCELPVYLGAVLDLSEDAARVLNLKETEGEVILLLDGDASLSVGFERGTNSTGKSGPDSV